ncbi:ankyrin repeat and SOCS box protein 8 [Octopus bimaculoides]|uniref:SOCS box domain-containing protein n=1 Tax=Octopus bimaculoides TaxID=37653 RepID=A0A0L8GHY7_OCTBM|nr:ankyrin repeat and SOCS box protein 8 [Octopus bimaculoides]|eukprot:XP_014780858.1 PREDICTED: ankyrin repeat and SOCS box protein 8-like [Octopus bimaculoides]
MEYITVDNFMDMELYKFHLSEHRSMESNWPPLCKACIDLDVNSIMKLIQSNVDVNLACQDGKTPLHLICDTQPENSLSLKITDLLISNGANIDSVDNEGSTPICIACKNNNIELVKLLLKSGCTINTSSYLLNTPMKVTSRNANNWFCCHTHSSFAGDEQKTIYIPPPIHIAKLLLEADGQQSKEATCLPSAVQFSNYDIVKDLLESGMSPNLLDENSCTALGCACMIESVDPKVVELLLQYGANVNRGSSWKKQKPLIFAFAHNALEKIKILLSYGAWITSEEMTELVSVNLSKYILENPESVEIDSEEFLSWRLLLAAGFTPTLHGTINVTDSLFSKLEQIEKCNNYKQVIPWLTSLLFPERTLKEWCRISIRRHLKVSIDDNIKKLHIPNSLKDFLLFNEFERNKFSQ